MSENAGAEEGSDVHTPEQRSYNMSQIQSQDTDPELKLRKALWHMGYRYRVHTDLPGTPDIVFRGPEVAVFVDGCFWHGCPEHQNIPETNREFWEKKFQRNEERDKEVNRRLTDAGWRVVRVWEHEVNQDLEETARRVARIVDGES